ncbi:MAG: bifunctional phosphopantothenoylcysteine decarboxylase/phosphopantothenate--cysteine ligase CoaBC [Peptostreptococcaceae bacterium]|nr:bifunctional phosphopantothenoylcysteine decarboxylase/phosphopantothenate--cysteine ligase CoaBC [Peptostreptococcaceae bacterium]
MKKTLVLGVTGGIAAYKACDLVSSLVKKDVNIQVIMTEHAVKFVSPLTFQSLSGNYVTTDMFEEPRSWDIEHIALAKKADVFAIVPATANVIGKIAGGVADDMLTTTVMATRAPLVIAPAMNTNMYENPILQENLEKLKSLGCDIIEPAFGRLACADVGRGKLADVIEIEERILFHLNKRETLEGKKVVITAGPTREGIDPARYLTNYSSGKMGYALAEQAALMGAQVTLISGPVNLRPSSLLQKVTFVSSTQQMYRAAMEEFERADIMIKAAAVSDYRPKNFSDSKVKKKDEELFLELQRNPDIAMELGKVKKHQILIGFAAETDDILENAKKKLDRKNLDFIVLNDIKQEGAGFNTDTNIAKIISREEIEDCPLMSKAELSVRILEKAAQLLKH